jgi:hypothetical protein
MDDSGIGRENRRLHWRPTCVNEPPMERNLDNGFEIEFDFIGP